MKQCVAIGCDPSGVEFAGSVRKGLIHTNSLFNSKAFRTALSALQDGGVLDMPGGHAARVELKERFAQTPCTPEQMNLAAALLANDPMESFDGMLKTDRWDLGGQGLDDAGVAAIVKRALSSGGGVAHVKEIDLGGNKLQDKGAKALAEVIAQTTRLERLNLANNQIGDAGIAALATAMETGAALLRHADLA